MRLRKRLALVPVLLLVLLPLVLALGAVWWLTPEKAPPSAPAFRGKTAAEWERELATWDREVVTHGYFRPAPAWRVWLNRATWGRWPSAYPVPVLEGEAPLVQGAPDAVPVLIELLQSTDPEIRYRAALAIRETRSREAALPAVPALLRALGDPEENVRFEAANAVWDMDREAARRGGVYLDGGGHPVAPPPRIPGAPE